MNYDYGYGFTQTKLEYITKGHIATHAILLNQACTGHRSVCAWFLEFVFVRISVCLRVCVSAPEAINN